MKNENYSYCSTSAVKISRITEILPWAVAEIDKGKKGSESGGIMYSVAKKGKVGKRTHCHNGKRRIGEE